MEDATMASVPPLGRVEWRTPSARERVERRRLRAAQHLPTICPECLDGHFKPCRTEWCCCICHEPSQPLIEVVPAMADDEDPVDYAIRDYYEDADRNAS